MKRTARSAAQVADEARQKVDETAEDLAEGVKEALGRTRPAGNLPDEVADPVGRLAARYNEIRWTMPSGPERTGEMTAVLHEMIELLRRGTDFDVAANLRSQDSGLRLPAVAFLNANPDPRWAGDLAQTALAEDKPFNAYWAFRTLRQVLAGHCEALDALTRRRLDRQFNRQAPNLATRAIVHVGDRNQDLRGLPTESLEGSDFLMTGGVLVLPAISTVSGHGSSHPAPLPRQRGEAVSKTRVAGFCRSGRNRPASAKKGELAWHRHCWWGRIRPYGPVHRRPQTNPHREKIASEASRDLLRLRNQP